MGCPAVAWQSMIELCICSSRGTQSQCRCDSHWPNHVDQQMLTRPPLLLQRLLEEDDLLRSQLRCKCSGSVELSSKAEA